MRYILKNFRPESISRPDLGTSMVLILLQIVLVGFISNRFVQGEAQQNKIVFRPRFDATCIDLTLGTTKEECEKSSSSALSSRIVLDRCMPGLFGLSPTSTLALMNKRNYWKAEILELGEIPVVTFRTGCEADCKNCDSVTNLSERELNITSSPSTGATKCSRVRFSDLDSSSSSAAVFCTADLFTLQRNNCSTLLLSDGAMIAEIPQTTEFSVSIGDGSRSGGSNERSSASAELGGVPTVPIELQRVHYIPSLIAPEVTATTSSPAVHPSSSASQSSDEGGKPQQQKKKEEDEDKEGEREIEPGDLGPSSNGKGRKRPYAVVISVVALCVLLVLAYFFYDLYHKKKIGQTFRQMPGGGGGGRQAISVEDADGFVVTDSPPQSPTTTTASTAVSRQRSSSFTTSAPTGGKSKLHEA